eukprot:m.258442 g.258442  ORF g.258442 m.258442 type:complete len:86 (+) comp19643_c1_seq27:1789-2046(+)
MSREAKPLYDLKKKGVKFNWTEETQKAFEELKGLAANCTELSFSRMMETCCTVPTHPTYFVTARTAYHMLYSYFDPGNDNRSLVC